MSSAIARKFAQQNRLRKQLKKKKESLADQFHFKVYVVFHFKEKPCSVYESTEAVTVMTNDFKDDIIKKTKVDGVLSKKSEELFVRDLVQIHLSKWKPVHKGGTLGSSGDIDFFFWPRKDVEKIECILFSKWHDDPHGRYLPLEHQFLLESVEWQSRLQGLMMVNDFLPSTEQVITNANQDVFLFVSRHQTQCSNKRSEFIKLRGLCLYIPQDELLMWQAYSCSDVLQNYI